MPTSPSLIAKFEQATSLYNSGKIEQALAAYQKIANISAPINTPSLNPLKNFLKKAETVTGEFLATVMMRQVYCLMDLGRYEEAKDICASKEMELLAGQLSIPELYYYCFSYGNVLGNLGQIQEMDRMMTHAMRIASESLGDNQKSIDTWYWLLHWGKIHQQWDYLYEQCTLAHQFGINIESYMLQNIAGENAFFALRGLNRREEANIRAQNILSMYSNAGVVEKAREWETLLQSVQ